MALVWLVSLGARAQCQLTLDIVIFYGSIILRGAKFALERNARAAFIQSGKWTGHEKANGIQIGAATRRVIAFTKLCAIT